MGNRYQRHQVERVPKNQTRRPPSHRNRAKTNFGSRRRNYLFGPARSASSIGPEHSFAPRTTKRPRSRQTSRRSRCPKDIRRCRCQAIRSIRRTKVRESTRSTSFPRLQKVQKLFSKSVFYFSKVIFVLKHLFFFN